MYLDKVPSRVNKIKMMSNLIQTKIISIAVPISNIQRITNQKVTALPATKVMGAQHLIFLKSSTIPLQTGQDRSGRKGCNCKTSNYNRLKKEIRNILIGIRTLKFILRFSLLRIPITQNYANKRENRNQKSTYETKTMTRCTKV